MRGKFTATDKEYSLKIITYLCLVCRESTVVWEMRTSKELGIWFCLKFEILKTSKFVLWDYAFSHNYSDSVLYFAGR